MIEAEHDAAIVGNCGDLGLIALHLANPGVSTGTGSTFRTVDPGRSGHSRSAPDSCRLRRATIRW
jgi:hypothetical protein